MDVPNAEALHTPVSVTEMLISDATRRTRTPSQIRIDMASEFKMVGRRGLGHRLSGYGRQ